MSGRVITGTVGVWLTRSCGIGPTDLKDGEDAALVRGFTFTHIDMAPDWTRIGNAELKITLAPNDAIVTDAIASLRAEQTRLRAEAERKSTDIERQIQTLLAISFDGSAA